MCNYKTEQEAFWAGEFGTMYIYRNSDRKHIASCTKMFSDIFSQCKGVDSVLELGANRGNNMEAIKCLLPESKLTAVEINKDAVAELKKIKFVTTYHCSILNFEVEDQFDFVFTRGVLIHINPDQLELVYDKMYNLSKKYICIAEYYNPTPVSIPYQGHSDRLFKRDFAGDLLKKFDDLKLIEYKFIYHNDWIYPQDDITWFLMEKLNT